LPVISEIDTIAFSSLFKVNLSCPFSEIGFGIILKELKLLLISFKKAGNLIVTAAWRVLRIV